jgi:hypothetical protein
MRERKRNKNPKSNHSGLGAFLGSIAGGIPGNIMAAAGAGGLAWPVTELGWIAGGAAGGYVGAKSDRKNRGALGGAVGGIFGPIGAAIGGWYAGREPDTKQNPMGTATLVAIGAGIGAMAVGYGGYRYLQKRKQQRGLPAVALEKILVPNATLGEAPFVVDDVKQPILLRSTAGPLPLDDEFDHVPELSVLVPMPQNDEVQPWAGVSFGIAGELGESDNRMVLVTETGDYSVVDTPGKAIAQLVTNLEGEYARLVYELSLIQIDEGVNWADPAERDGAIGRILEKVASGVDWSKGLSPFAFGSEPYTAWTAVQLLGTVANQSHFNKQAESGGA